MRKNSITQVLKWALIALLIYSIFRCVRTDSEAFNAMREDFNTIPRHVASGGEGAPSEIREPQCNSSPSPGTGRCGGAIGGKGNCVSATGDKLLPVLDPCFNMREICKQCILLEDHLFQREKRCEDCIKKHFLTLEGLAEEAITLDRNNEYNLSKYHLPETLRKLQKQFLNRDDCESIAQQLRQIRKPLMAKFFDKF